MFSNSCINLFFLKMFAKNLIQTILYCFIIESSILSSLDWYSWIFVLNFFSKCFSFTSIRLFGCRFQYYNWHEFFSSWWDRQKARICRRATFRSRFNYNLFWTFWCICFIAGCMFDYRNFITVVYRLVWVIFLNFIFQYFLSLFKLFIKLFR